MAFGARLRQAPSICMNVAYKVKELSDVYLATWHYLLFAAPKMSSVHISSSL